MEDFVNDLMQRYRKLPLLIDANLLLLLFLGRVESKKIERYKRTSKYRADDYVLLELLIEPFERFLTTPNILTEVSNLSGYLEEPLRSRYFRYFGEAVQSLFEVYSPSSTISQSATFVHLGLTDAGIVHLLSQEKCLVLTDDLDLFVLISSSGFDAINFTHLRESYFGL